MRKTHPPTSLCCADAVEVAAVNDAWGDFRCDRFTRVASFYLVEKSVG